CINASTAPRGDAMRKASGGGATMSTTSTELLAFRAAEGGAGEPAESTDRHPAPRQCWSLYREKSTHTFVHLAFRTEDFTQASMKAMPATPSAMPGNITAGSTLRRSRFAMI